MCQCLGRALNVRLCLAFRVFLCGGGEYDCTYRNRVYTYGSEIERERDGGIPFSWYYMNIENGKVWRKCMEERENMKTCFIITPIGATGSIIRRKIDGVIEEVIEPILDELGYEVTVSHKISESGFLISIGGFAVTIKTIVDEIFQIMNYFVEGNYK